MQAWILDESPGAYRWGSIDLPGAGRRRRAIRVVASALNHMDLWVTRGAPKPPLPHVPGCDVAGVVDGGRLSRHHGGGRRRGRRQSRRVVGRRHRRTGATTARWARLHDLRRALLGRSRRDGDRAGAQRSQASSDRVRWEECAAFPLAYLTAYRMLRRARLKSGDTLLVVGIGSGVSCAALALGTRWARGSRSPVAAKPKRAQALEMGAAAAHDSAAAKWPVEADVVVESVGPATWEQSVRSLKPGGRMVVCGSTSGPKVELTLPRLFFKQFEIIGSTMGSYQEFDEVLALVEQRPADHHRPSFPLDGLRGCARPPRARRAARQDRADATKGADHGCRSAEGRGVCARSIGSPTSCCTPATRSTPIPS